MKQQVPGHMQFFAVATVLFFITSCNKQPLHPTGDLVTNETNNAARFDGPTTIAAANPFNRRVGAPVDGRTGTRWIANYKKKYGYYKTYTLNNHYIQIIVSQPNCVGISLHYALDANNKTHILPIGVNVYGKIMKCAEISTMQGNISWATAQQWIATDKGTIDSHFLGSNTFERLNKNPCKSIRIDFAIDDNNEQHLLLSNPCILSLVKQYEDRDMPCPKFCPNP